MAGRVNILLPSVFFWRGALAMLPMTIAAAPFGVMVGALAAQKGLDGWQVMMMSALVYAGAAQFMALDIWHDPVPVLTIVGATALVNLRHVMMGAALGVHIRHLPGWIKWSYVCVMSDETWAMGLHQSAKGRLAGAYVLGVILPFYLNWIFWSVLGAALGAVISDPARYGLDFVFTAVFISLTMGFWRQNRHSLGLFVAAGAALASLHFIGGAWHVFIGALAGTLCAALVGEKVGENVGENVGEKDPDA